MSDTSKPILPDRLVEKIIMSAASARGGDGITQEEAIQLVRWCEGVALKWGLLQTVFDGSLLIDWNGEDAVFSEPSTEQHRALLACFERTERR